MSVGSMLRLVDHEKYIVVYGSMRYSDLLKDSVVINNDKAVPVTVYRGRKAGAFSSAVFQCNGRGYAGEIVVLVGVNVEGVVQGVRVLKHSKPGLGDKIEEAKSSWIHSFEGKALGTAKWGVKKDGGEFDQFAGATITPRGVVRRQSRRPWNSIPLTVKKSRQQRKEGNHELF